MDEPAANPTIELELDAPVLVCVVTHPDELARARTAHWYRVPLTRQVPQLAVEALAFYQTGAFGNERHQIRWLAPVVGATIATRRELIPEQPAHPRADDRYLRYALGPLCALPFHIPARRLRRITFIATDYGRLVGARDVADLWLGRPQTTPPVWGAGLGRGRTPAGSRPWSDNTR